MKITARATAAEVGSILMHPHHLPLLDVAHGIVKTVSNLIMIIVRNSLIVKVGVQVLG